MFFVKFLKSEVEMLKKNVKRGIFGIIALLFGLGLWLDSSPVQAAAYEFWGTPASIRCHLQMHTSYENGVDVNASGQVIVASGKSSGQVVLYHGNEVTCNGWKLQSCAGTNCQLNPTVL